MSAPGRRPLDLVAVLFAYVLPLALVVGLLAAVGLGQLALGLLAVEGCVVVAVVVVRRRPPRPAGMGAPSSRPWLVPTVMCALVGGVVAISVLAARTG